MDGEEEFMEIKYQYKGMIMIKRRCTSFSGQYKGLIQSKQCYSRFGLRKMNKSFKTSLILGRFVTIQPDLKFLHGVLFYKMFASYSIQDICLHSNASIFPHLICFVALFDLISVFSLLYFNIPL